jgi:hypothetical protein
MEDDVPLAAHPMKRIYGLNKPELPYLIVGIIGGFLVGCTWPIFSILFSNVIGVRLCLPIDYKRFKRIDWKSVEFIVSLQMPPLINMLRSVLTYIFCYL